MDTTSMHSAGPPPAPPPDSQPSGGHGIKDEDDSADWKLGFPWKLHKILKDAEEEGFGDIISWTPNGKAFVVLDKERFAAEIMPRYFRSSKFKTFQRSSNMWGFQTAIRHYPYQGLERGDCHHELFRKGRLDLCHGMARIKSLKEEAEIQRRNAERARKNNARNPSMGVAAVAPRLAAPSAAAAAAARPPSDLLNAVRVLAATLQANPTFQNMAPAPFVAAAAAAVGSSNLVSDAVLRQIASSSQHQPSNNNPHNQGPATMATVLASLEANAATANAAAAGGGGGFMGLQQAFPSFSNSNILNEGLLQHLLQAQQSRNAATNNAVNGTTVQQLLSLQAQSNQANNAAANAQWHLPQALQSRNSAPNAAAPAANVQQLVQSLQAQANASNNGAPNTMLQVALALQAQVNASNNHGSSAGPDIQQHIVQLLQAQAQIGAQALQSQSQSQSNASTTAGPNLQQIVKLLQQASATEVSSSGGSSNSERVNQALQAQGATNNGGNVGGQHEVSDVSDISSDDSDNPGQGMQPAGQAAGGGGNQPKDDDDNNVDFNEGSATLETARALQRLLASDEAKRLLSNFWRT